MKHAIKHIHFVGIGGSGMCGIAEVLFNQGFTISGSDLSSNAATQRLCALGLRVFLGHKAAHIEGADCIVTSTAVQPDNAEVLAARAKAIPIVPRAEMLAELMRPKTGIAIAGTHGKTTTTSLVTAILAAAQLDPTCVIGGKLNSAGANAQLGKGEYLVAEADESDASFLKLLPSLAVVTNIDQDHMDTYGHDVSKLDQAFLDFLHRMPFYGVAVLCADDAGVARIVPEVARLVVTYGLSEQAQVRAVNVRPLGTQMQFVCTRPGSSDLPITLNLPGEHNVQNALAAIAIASELNIQDAHIQSALAGFSGVGRRFQNYGTFQTDDGGAATFIDDYGHHPVEMNATLAAARGAYPQERLILVFQPHRYTRTRDCFEDFVAVMGKADLVILTEVYAAGEAPIAQADARALMHALRLSGKTQALFVERVSDLPAQIKAIAHDQDVVLCMGAGSIGSVGAQITAVPPFGETP